MECGTFDARDWVACSEVYLDCLADAVAAGAYTPYEALVRRLNLTDFSLGQAAQGSPDAALNDPSSAVRAAIEYLPPDVDGVARAAEDWRGLPRSELLRPRRLKNPLRPTLVINQMVDDSALGAWSSVYEKLP